MKDEKESLLEIGWWSNGRLSVADEFEQNPLGCFIRIKYKLPDPINPDDIVVVG